MELLQIRNVGVTYRTKGREIRAVDGVSFSIEEGKTVGLVGESGSGKSTLALAILRLLPRGTAVSGQILFRGKDLLTCGDAELRELRWKQIAVVFQQSMNALSPVHKIGQQLVDIYRVHNDGLSKREIRGKIEKLFEAVNLAPTYQLSGGMLQRVSIAASLLFSPPLLILDEATTALDVVTQGQILSEIEHLKERMHVTWMLISHDISVIASSCDRVAVMYAGRLMEYGDVDRVLSAPAHPYTRGLLNSLPSLRGERTGLKGIAGSLPDLGVPHKGCIFAPRCPFASEHCLIQEPLAVTLKDGRRVACILYRGDGDGSRSAG